MRKEFNEQIFGVSVDDNFYIYKVIIKQEMKKIFYRKFRCNFKNFIAECENEKSQGNLANKLYNEK